MPGRDTAATLLAEVALAVRENPMPTDASVCIVLTCVSWLSYVPNQAILWLLDAVAPSIPFPMNCMFCISPVRLTQTPMQILPGRFGIYRVFCL